MEKSHRAHKVLRVKHMRFSPTVGFYFERTLHTIKRTLQTDNQIDGPALWNGVELMGLLAISSPAAVANR